MLKDQEQDFLMDQYILPAMGDPNEEKLDLSVNKLPEVSPLFQGQQQKKLKLPIILQSEVSPHQNIYTFSKLQNYFLEQQIMQRSMMEKQKMLPHLQSSKTVNTLESNQNEELVNRQVINSSQNQQMVRNPSKSSLKQSRTIQDIKGNVKNAYIKKITSLLSMNDLKSNACEEDDDDSSSISQPHQERMLKDLQMQGVLGSCQDLLSLEQKNLKMKESAKNSRMRKKVYINMLENKVQTLHNQINKYSMGTSNALQYLETILHSNDSMHNLVVGQCQLVEQIKEQSQNQNANQEECILLLDSYQMRYGSAGVKRKQYIKYCIQNIARLLLQSNYGMLLLATGDQEKSRPDEFNDYIKEFKQITGILDENQIYKIFNIINQIIDHKKRHQLLIKNLSKEYNKIRRYQSALDEVVSNMNQILTPTQNVSLISYIDEKMMSKSPSIQTL